VRLSFDIFFFKSSLDYPIPCLDAKLFFLLFSAGQDGWILKNLFTSDRDLTPRRGLLVRY